MEQGESNMKILSTAIEHKRITQLDLNIC